MDALGDACDTDDDNDLVLDADDCAQLDPTTSTTPGEVRDVRLSKVPATRLQWFEKDPDDRYDVAGGDLGALRALGAGGAGCLADNRPVESWDDPRPDPPPGEGLYYLVSRPSPERLRERHLRLGHLGRRAAAGRGLSLEEIAVRAPWAHRS